MPIKPGQVSITTFYCNLALWKHSGKLWCQGIILFFISHIIPILVNAQNKQAYHDSLYRLIALPANDTSMVGRLNLLAFSFPLAKSDSVLKYTQRALRLANKLKYEKGAGRALFIESRCYRVTGDFATALQKGIESFNVFEKNGFIREAAEMDLDLAQIYKDMTSDKHTTVYSNTGIAYSKTAFKKFEQIQDTSGMVLSLNMSGILFRDKAINSQSYFYDSALNYFKQAFALIDISVKGREYTGKLDNNISQVYLEHKKDYKTALKYLFDAVKFNTENKRQSSLSYNYGNIARAYSSLQEHNNAIKYARLMLDATLAENAPARIENGYQEMYRAFKSAGSYDSALHYIILKDSLGNVLTNLTKSQQVMNLQVKYETASKELEISRLNKESESQKRSILVLVSVVIGILILSGIMFWLYQRIKVQKQQIALQSQKLALVMKELHHRVKNNLQIVSSLLSLQTYKLHDEESISVFKESQQRVQAMSLIHQRLYTSDLLTSVNMKEYITDLVETLLSSYGFGLEDFDLFLNISQEILDVEKALPIGLLINEMVTNSLKYAYKNVDDPRLEIHLNDVDGQLKLVVKDNGSGINLNEWKKKGSSFGKQLIQVLGKQLRAQQTLSVDEGTSFTLLIPNKAA